MFHTRFFWGSLTLAAVVVALALTTAAALVFAQHQGATHGGMHAGAGHAAADPASATRMFQDANTRMHQGMSLALTGDADVDFARGMIPHHQGAIDMARILLEHGTDPALRKLAQDIIAAQESEIRFLREWLRGKGY